MIANIYMAHELATSLYRQNIIENCFTKFGVKIELLRILCIKGAKSGM